LFLIGTVALFLLPFVSHPLFVVGLSTFILYLAAIFVEALVSNRNMAVAVLSVPAALCQLLGYGLGFLREKFSRNA
jgi:hypothetical protein